MNDDGTAVVAWIRTQEELIGGEPTPISTVWARFFTPGDGWSGDERLDDGSPEKAYLHVGIDDDGNAMAVWMGSGVQAAYYQSGSEWADPYSVGESYPDFAMSAGGSAIALWRDDGADPSADDLWSRRFSPLDGWGDEVLVQAGTQLPYGVDPVLDPAGDALMAGVSEGGDSNEIWSSSGAADLAWSRVLDTAGPPRLAMDRQGNALAVWALLGGVGWRSSWYEAGVGWGETVVIDTVSNSDKLQAFGIDDEGNVVAVWLRPGSGNLASVWSNGYSVDAGWSEAVKISSAEGEAFGASVAVGSAGDAMATWMDNENGSVWANRYAPGDGWGVAEVVDATSVTFSPPDVGIDGDGNAIVVWSQNAWTSPEAAKVDFWISSP